MSPMNAVINLLAEAPPVQLHYFGPKMALISPANIWTGCQIARNFKMQFTGSQVRPMFAAAKF